MTTLRVLLETTALHRPGADRGIGRYLRAVLRHVCPQVDCEQWSAGGGSSAVWAEAVTVARRQAKVAASRAVFHAPGPFMTVPRPGKSVVSILDVIPLDAPYGQRSGVKTRLFHRWAARCGQVITLSSYSADRIRRLLDVEPERVVVAPLPPELPVPAPDERLRAAFPFTRRPYALALADRRFDDFRKRNVWLTAVARQLAGEAGLPLVVAGYATDTNPLDDTIGVGPVPDSMLAALMQHAVLFVYPSAYEGQGLPPMEALAMGTPVVAMHNTALPEMLAEGALLVEEVEPDPARAAVGPHSTSDAGAKALAEAAVRLALDASLQSDLGKHGRQHVATIDAAAFVHAHVDAYHRASTR